ncbi:ABC transporter ATP-binding protein [Rudaeicoccus suwonensis]|uniref:ABC-2 type transport system ATP-binding protein n=1 Tax=Rudaeicoccus suwonensis TaxID=657409 RepID=A0A561EBR6_9MICO|nr:ABC transporter ATP-binding protein [Rudaeicoccus suwonensis]TWE13042.1 ABC-2 type transport system ATP-binding protein [Rudaeicoccus suwonensis]
MITVEHLTRRYGSYVAVDDVSFEVRPGSVTGFLGPNGAGKSTCMRMICGLTPPSGGVARVLGGSYTDLPNPGRQVGVLLDAAAQHNGRTGREILSLGAILMGLPKSRVDEMLHLVGLNGDESKRRLRDYSLGMRQRLGIAHALLGDPKVLILDEPANGLDPAGIRWMRTLLRGFADEGGTVLLSSHLLHEIEVVADHFIVIGRGKIVANGPKSQLMAAAGTSVRSTDDMRLAGALQGAGFAVDGVGGAIRTDAEPAQVGRIALDQQIALIELKAAGSAGLEEMFLQLTAADAREGVAA